MKRGPARTGLQRIVFDPDDSACHLVDMTTDDLEIVVEILKRELDDLLAHHRGQDAARTRH